jgi:hypothetical protein
VCNTAYGKKFEACQGYAEQGFTQECQIMNCPGNLGGNSSSACFSSDSANCKEHYDELFPPVPIGTGAIVGIALCVVALLFMCFMVFAKRAADAAAEQERAEYNMREDDLDGQ